ncbi:conserved hypothetical protein [Vibrio chagasii]|nr:conserved hypothetical protein [Vibrio chagasii]
MNKLSGKSELDPKIITNNLSDKMHELVDLKTVMEDTSRKQVSALNAWIKAHSCKYLPTMVTLYHGTAKKHDILGEGIKRTKAKTKRSMQSQVGYTYLSLHPDSAKNFASIGYPLEEISVYAVEVPLYQLLPDQDQLFNARLWKELKVVIKKTVGDSLIFGKGARLKRDIEPYEIKLVKI